MPNSPLGSSQLTFGSLFSEAWERLKSRLKTLIALEVVGLLVPVLGFILLVKGGYSPETPEQVAAHPLGVVGGLLVLLGIFFYIAVKAGELFVLVSTGSANISTALRHGSKRWLPVLGHGLVITLIFIPLYAIVIGSGVFAVFGGKTEAILLWLVLAVILVLFYVYIMTRLSFVIPLAALGEPGGTFRQSWALTGGRFWKVFWLWFLFTLVIGIASMVVQIIVGMVTPNGSIIAQILDFIVRALFSLMSLAYMVTFLRRLQKSN